LLDAFRAAIARRSAITVDDADSGRAKGEAEPGPSAKNRLGVSSAPTAAMEKAGR